MSRQSFIENLIKENYNYQQIGNKLGLSRQRVYQLAKKFDLVNIKRELSKKLLAPKNPRIRDGYRMIWKPDHPKCCKGGFVAEHRLVMEEKLQRPLEKWETIHHLDGNKLNNTPENLIVVTQKHHPLYNQMKCPYCSKMIYFYPRN